MGLKVPDCDLYPLQRRESLKVCLFMNLWVERGRGGCLMLEGFWTNFGGEEEEEHYTERDLRMGEVE